MKGVQHKKCTDKVLREKFHYKRNTLKKMNRAWEQGKRVSKTEWFALNAEVEGLAKQSDEASWAKGEPFTDSQGVRRLEKVFEEASIVARAIDLYRKRTT